MYIYEELKNMTKNVLKNDGRVIETLSTSTPPKKQSKSEFKDDSSATNFREIRQFQGQEFTRSINR